ncbi:MAG: tRNA (uridine(54)-C5)-methyltransferase TrmA [Sulfurovum sp.]|jgi:tRNA (uracil-5-)-methyltransferase|nr:MAG: tRNA/tmRNA (uracil-C(5))-methyltransferase [Arcobacter lacus]
MNCEYFGKCGSCTLHDKTYEEQLDYKINIEKDRFKEFGIKEFDIIKSDDSNFRFRAEFRIWKNFDDEENPTLSYAMNNFDKNALEISSCQIVSKNIKDLMPILLNDIKDNEILKTKLFGIEFLASTTNDMLVTLIYHQKLDEKWQESAKKLQSKHHIKIIGRSRKQKVVLSEDYICETLNINKQDFKFEYKEGGFTQPNTKVNAQMIQWVLNNIESSKDDLCELYCGGGNFTIPLSTKFNKVLATEISKTSIKSALKNCELNGVENIDFIRMSAEEFVDALNETREYRRLKDVNLKDFNFKTIFVDPPRAGLDDFTREFVSRFDEIIYISCNPETLHRDLQTITNTHKIENFGFFDQFAYSKHIESGVVLSKR